MPIIQILYRLNLLTFMRPVYLNLNIDKALFYQNWKPALNFLETSKFTSDWYKSFYQENNQDMLAFYQQPD